MSKQYETDFLPKVSVVIPVYNGANYLREAIDSALAQTYPNVEVIVVNDGSRDDGATREIALSYGDRIRYFEKENGGVSTALNRGIREMTGEYFSWLSHDDRYEPEKVARQIAYLGTIPERDKLIPFCGSCTIDYKSEVLYRVENFLENHRIYEGEEVLCSLLTHGMMNPCCMLIPREAFETCGYFNEDLRYNQDAMLLYQIFSKGYRIIADTDNVDVAYRMHVAQTSKTRRDLLIRDSNAAAKIIAPTFADMTTKENRLLRCYAQRHARQACREAVQTCLSIGKEAGVLCAADVLYVRSWLLFGYIRSFLKKIYHTVRFKK